MHKTGTNWASELGLTTQQWSVLGALSSPRGREGIAVGEFAEFLLLTRQNLSSVLTRLESLGLTDRICDHPDGRVKKVVLTDEGKALWSKLNKEIQSYCHVALDNFTPQEKGMLQHLVDKLRGNLVELDRNTK